MALDRGHAIELIRRHGGQYSRKINARTTIVVVGVDAWPLGDDGRLTTQFQRMRELEHEHPSADVIGEAEFLARLGLARSEPGMVRRYSLPELSELLQVPARQLERWCKMGLILSAETRDGIRWFNFAEVAACRALARLKLAGISSARIRRSLRQLAEVLADRHVQLSAVASIERSGRLLWRDDRMHLIDPTGQLHLEFEQTDAASHVNFEQHKVNDHDAFQRAREAEERGDLVEAVREYRALLEHGDNAQMSYNLGTVLHKLGQDAEAADVLADAVDAEPGWAEAWNNLGLALGGLGRLDEARAALEQALRWRSHYADAEFNLADVLEQAGKRREARKHWAKYLQYDSAGPWAAHARKRLRGE
jgi:DNA-binding transcriptional MerR regulator